MSNIYCHKSNCANLSKRKSKSVNKKGDPLYRCLLADIILLNYCPGDGEEYADGKVCECLNFKHKDGT